MSIARQMMMAAAGGAGGGGGGLPVEDVFSTDLYAGNSSTQTITNGIDLAGVGGLVWVKNRTQSAHNHRIFDTVRGMTFASAKEFEPPSTGAESNRPNTIRANSDGFSLGTLSYFSSYNASGNNYVAWTFRKAPRFFDVVTWTGDSNSTQTLPHDLGCDVGAIFVKATSTSNNWETGHIFGASSFTQAYLNLDSQGYSRTYPFRLQSQPTTTEIVVEGSWNIAGTSYVAYLLAHDTAAGGVIQCGSYVGNGSSTGPVINLGWEPQWLLIKNASSSGSWTIWDSARGENNSLVPNSNGAENSFATGDYFDFTPTGINIKTSLDFINGSGKEIIYLAIRKEDA